MPLPATVLFVAPHEVSTGEAVTALHMARELAAAGVSCAFLTSALCAELVAADFSERVTVLTGSREANQALWTNALARWAPEAIVFAEYPLLFFASGSVPLADEAWVGALEETSAALFTLDHLGYARCRSPVFFGPPHLPVGVYMPVALPVRMRVLLPCPTNEPDAARNGTPFRYWPLAPPLDGARRDAVRARYIEPRDELLVLHPVPNWAHRLAAQMRLPHYRHLSRFLERWLTGTGRRVTVLSINGAQLLAPSRVPDVRFVNAAMLPPGEYEDLIRAADLLITDNAVSATLGKAVCSLTPAALLCNSHRLPELLEQQDGWCRQHVLRMENEQPGCIFPFEVFPIWNRRELQERECCDPDGYGRTFARAEWFSDEGTRDVLQSLLVDASARAALQERQRAYVDRLEGLPTAAELFARV